MQNKMNDIELLIKRFIRKEISKLKPRDNDYANQFLNDEFSKLMKCITKDKVMEGLYHKYRLGFDILEILNNKKFYYDLPHEKFPMLFKVEPSVTIPVSKVKKKSAKLKSKDGFTEPQSLEGMEMPPEITLIKEQIPFVQKALIRKAKRYIAIMELKSWIEKNGLKSPKIDFSKFITDNVEDSNKDITLITIENYLKSFNEGQIINDGNYNKLINLLYKFFKDNSNPTLKEPIVVKYGSVKKLAFALGGIYKELSDKPLSYEYLLLGKNNISLFLKEDISSKSFQKTNLYKYYSTKP